MRSTARAWTLALVTLTAGAAFGAPAPGAPAPGAPAPAAPAGDPDTIVAIVNGEVITQADVSNRARLFALSSGIVVAPDALGRLRPQITRELIDDRLRLQEIQRRRIVIADSEVAQAIGDVEKRNGLPPGGLRAKLSGQGVAFSTLINQIRTQLGWTRVLRQQLSARGQITDAEVAEQERILKQQEGQPQYRVAEVFVAAEDPTHANEAQKFAATVIQQLHAGAPFGIVAAEFSQSQTALQGGELGWLRPDQLDPPIAALVSQMPIGAVSNPVQVAGGYSVVTLLEKRLVGSDLATVLNLRQAFFPFDTVLDPANPTPGQKKALEAAQALSRIATSCPDMESANKAQGSQRATDPGPVRLDRLNGQMQELLGALQPGHASRALVTPQGVLVVMLCSSEKKNMAAMTRDDIGNQLLEQRVELASRQLQQDLKRRALIDQRSS